MTLTFFINFKKNFDPICSVTQAYKLVFTIFINMRSCKFKKIMINSANKIVGFLKSYIYAMEMIIFLKKIRVLRFR
jgi:hypothetical protein